MIGPTGAVRVMVATKPACRLPQLCADHDYAESVRKKHVVLTIPISTPHNGCS
jgi:hypothetical protein